MAGYAPGILLSLNNRETGVKLGPGIHLHKGEMGGTCQVWIFVAYYRQGSKWPLQEFSLYLLGYQGENKITRATWQKIIGTSSTKQNYGSS